jgi:hypothetical protein
MLLTTLRQTAAVSAPVEEGVTWGAHGSEIALTNGNKTATYGNGQDEYYKTRMSPAQAVGTFFVYMEYMPHWNFSDDVDMAWNFVTSAADATTPGELGPGESLASAAAGSYNDAMWSGIAVRSDGVTVYVWNRNDDGTWVNDADPGVSGNETAIANFPAETFYFMAIMYADTGESIGMTINGEGDFEHTPPTGSTPWN